MLRYTVAPRDLERYPFVVQMATQHGTKRWFENPAYQRLSPDQLRLTHDALGAAFFPFEAPENQEIGEVVSVTTVTRNQRKGWRDTINLPVPIDAIVTSENRTDYNAACLSYEARRLKSNGGLVALRGILPTDIATLVAHDMEDTALRRDLMQTLVTASDLTPVFIPDFAAIDEQKLTFCALYNF